MRPDLRICLPADQLHGPAWLQEMHAPQSGSVDYRTALARLHVRLRAALGCEDAETRIKAAVASLPELCPRRRQLAFRQGRRRGDAVFVVRKITPPPQLT